MHDAACKMWLEQKPSKEEDAMQKEIANFIEFRSYSGCRPAAKLKNAQLIVIEIDR